MAKFYAGEGGAVTGANSHKTKVQFCDSKFVYFCCVYPQKIIQLTVKIIFAGKLLPPLPLISNTDFEFYNFNSMKNVFISVNNVVSIRFDTDY